MRPNPSILQKDMMSPKSGHPDRRRPSRGGKEQARAWNLHLQLQMPEPQRASDLLRRSKHNISGWSIANLKVRRQKTDPSEKQLTRIRQLEYISLPLHGFRNDSSPMLPWLREARMRIQGRWRTQGSDARKP